MLSELTEVLGSEAQVLDDLISAAVDKQVALLASRAADVPDIAEREEELISRMREMEARRFELASGLAALMEVPDGSLTLSSVIGSAAGEHARRLSELRALLIARTRRLEEVNRTNALLLAQSLDIAAAWLEAASGRKANATYGPNGRVGLPHVGVSSVSARL